MLVRWSIRWSIRWLYLFLTADFAVSRLAETYYCPCQTDVHAYSTLFKATKRNVVDAKIHAPNMHAPQTKAYLALRPKKKNDTVNFGA